MLNLYAILPFFVAYLIGSIPTAVLISKFIYGTDIRTFGSGNAGSTNMFRTFGFKAGITTQVIDIAKGCLAASIPRFCLKAGLLSEGEKLLFFDPPIDAMLCGLAAVIGHVWPIFAGFRGGKGINTLLGMMILVYPLGAGISIVVFILSLFLTKMVSVGSILGSFAFPVFACLMKFPSGLKIDWIITGLGFFMFLLIVFTHRTNLARIFKGKENKVNLFQKK